MTFCTALHENSSQIQLTKDSKIAIDVISDFIKSREVIYECFHCLMKPKNIQYYALSLCLIEKKYHKKMENNKIKPPENVVTKADFKPLHIICGAMLEISG